MDLSHQVCLDNSGTSRSISIPHKSDKTCINLRKGEGESSADDVEHEHDQHCATWRTDLRISRHLCLIRYCHVVAAKDKSFKVHRALLKARSPVMKSMLKKNPDEIDLRAFDEEGVNTLLEYIYTGEVKSMKITSACDVYEAALLFQLPLLKKHCVRFMKSNLTVPLMPRVAQLAHKHQEKKLMSKVEYFCSQNLMDIVKTEEWVELLGSDSKLANDILKAALEINGVGD